MKPLDSKALKPATPDAGATAPAEAAAGPPSVLSAPPGLDAVWHALTRRWLTILVLGGGLGALAAAVAWYVVPAKYVGTTVLHLEAPRPQGPYDVAPDIVVFRASMTAWVKNDAILDAVLKKPAAAELPTIQALGKDGALPWLRSAAVVVDDKTLPPEALRLDVAADRPDDAAALANLWGQTCGEIYVAQQKERINRVSQSYHEMADALRTKKIALQTRRDQLGPDDPKAIDARVQVEETARLGLMVQRDTIDTDADKLRTRADDLRKAIASPDTVTVPLSAVEEEIDKDFPQNPVVKSQIDEMLAVQKKLGERQAHLLPADVQSDPGLVEYRREIAALQKTIADERKEMTPEYEKRGRARTLDRMKDDLAKAEQDLTALEAQGKTLSAKLADKEKVITALRNREATAARSNPDVQAAQSEVDEMETSLRRVGDEQAGLEARMALAPSVAVQTPAAPPAWPTLDKRLKAMSGAFFSLFGLVFLGVAVIEFRVRRVYKSGDVSEGLGLPLVGTVPTLSVAARTVAPVADDVVLGPMFESVDAIRTTLVHAARSETLRVVMVASAVSGEGKTSVASHLAASLARGGRRTLLVDGDLRNPAVHKLFGLTAGPGFAELLRGEMEPAQVVQNTTLENLSVLAAGAADRRALQALAQDGILRTVFDELKEQYDFLIVDVSPVLPVADALLIGEHVDAALMSVLRNVSRLPAVHAAQQRLATLGIRVLGAVVIGEGVEVYGDVRYPSVASSPTK